MLVASRLTRRFGSATAVNGLSLELKTGRCMALLGANGAGKTTTLRMLAGMLEPSEGAIKFVDEGTAEGDPRGKIGYLPQFPAFFGWMSGAEYLRFVGGLAGLSAGEAATRTTELLERVGLKDAAGRKTGGYSGGMKQRLGIAQAIIHRPRLLLLDEPVSALDPHGRREVMELLRELKQETTILFSTHVLHDAAEMCDDITIMDKGKSVMSGSLSELTAQYQKPIIKLTVAEDAIPWAEGLRSRSYIQHFQQEGRQIQIKVADLEEGRHALLQDIAANRIRLEAFAVGQTTLEDLFLKAVES